MASMFFPHYGTWKCRNSELCELCRIHHKSWNTSCMGPQFITGPLPHAYIFTPTDSLMYQIFLESERKPTQTRGEHVKPHTIAWALEWSEEMARECFQIVKDARLLKSMLQSYLLFIEKCSINKEALDHRINFLSNGRFWYPVLSNALITSLWKERENQEFLSVNESGGGGGEGGWESRWMRQINICSVTRFSLSHTQELCLC